MAAMFCCRWAAERFVGDSSLHRDLASTAKRREHQESKVPVSSDRKLAWCCRLKWDSKNWSCTYDSLFVILHDLWIECGEPAGLFRRT